MKSLQKFINESLENSTLQNVNVKYNVEPSEFVVEVPVSYSEDDITIYMGDKLFNNLSIFSLMTNSDGFGATSPEVITDKFFISTFSFL